MSVSVQKSTDISELSDIFPALLLYKNEHSEVNLKKLCTEIQEFCKDLYASTLNDSERAVYRKMVERLNF